MLDVDQIMRVSVYDKFKQKSTSNVYYLFLPFDNSRMFVHEICTYAYRSLLLRKKKMSDSYHEIRKKDEINRRF